MARADMAHKHENFTGISLVVSFLDRSKQLTEKGFKDLEIPKQKTEKG